MGSEMCIRDSYSAVIEMSDAPSDLKAMVLVNRGITYSQQNETKKAIADYIAVIEMSDAPSDQKAKALVIRGATYSQQNETKKAIADYIAVIEMSDAPSDQKAMALSNRGVVYWRSEEFAKSLDDFKLVSEIPGVSRAQTTDALFAVVEPMVALESQATVITALSKAFAEGDSNAEGYGGTPDDLLRMVLRGSPADWASYANEIARLFIDFDSAEKLGQGLAQSIRHLDEGGYSATQMDAWNLAWQEAGKNSDYLEIPLRCLAAAVEVMKSDPKTDRPLFQLPLEIRRLVRPLLNKSLGEVENS